MKRILRFLMAFIFVTCWGGESYAQTQVFYESFDKCDKKGGNDGTWSGISTTGSLSSFTDNAGWNTTEGNPASKCARFGTADKLGTAITPALTNLNGSATLTFKAGAWSNDKNKTLKISISVGNLTYNGSSASSQTITMESGKFTDYEMQITDGTSESKITFSAATTKNNRFFLDEVKITSNDGSSTTTVTAPTFSLNAGSYTTAQTLTLTADEGATIYYTTDGTEPTSESTKYEGAITVDKSMTVKAIAYDKDNNPSSVVTKSYTLPIACANIAAVKQNETGTLVTLTLNNAKVLYVNSYTSKEKDYNEIFVRDATGAIEFYNLGENAIKAGDVLNGTITAVYTVYKNLPELTEEKNITSFSDVKATAGDAAEPVAVNLADLGEKHYCDLVAVKGTAVSVESKKYYLTSGEVKVQLYDKLKLSYANPYADANVDVTGIYTPNDETMRIFPLAATDIVYNFSESAATTFGSVASVSARLTRTLSSEYWNTFCSPFAISAEQLKSVFGEGVKLTKYVGEEGFTMKFEEATEIEAGAAYLVKPAATVENPFFQGVTITANVAAAESKGTSYKFNGVLNPTNLDATKDLFITKDGNVSKIGSAEGYNHILGLRAYIATSNADAAAKALTLAIDGETTAIATIDGQQLGTACNVYNLQGQLVGRSLNEVKKGIYVVNGKKVFK